MKLEDQLCTFEQAKVLKSLGVSQHSLYYLNGRGYPIEAWVLEGDTKKFFSAYTVAEISQMLPDYYPSWRFKKSEQSTEIIWVATVICGPKPEGIDNIRTASAFDRYGKTQAEALATLLIALLETETITAEDCNKRLLEA
jgi:hypothetical protein